MKTTAAGGTPLRHRVKPSHPADLQASAQDRGAPGNFREPPPHARFPRHPHGRAHDWHLSLYTHVIVKYRDAKTDAKIQIEDLLR